MSNTLTLLEDVRDLTCASDEVLKEARTRRNAVLEICRSFPGTLGVYSSGSVAMGV